jgi:hypothetical protein
MLLECTGVCCGVDFFSVLSRENPRQARSFQYLNSPMLLLDKAGGRFEQNIFVGAKAYDVEVLYRTDA